MIEKITFLFLFLASLLCADTNNKANDYVNNVRAKVGQNIINSNKGKTVTDTTGGKKDDFLSSVIYTDIFYQSSHGYIFKQEGAVAQKDKFDLDNPLTKKVKNTIVAINNTRKKMTPKKRKDIAYFVGGFCDVLDTTYVSRASEFSNFDCILNFGKGRYRHAKITAGIYPDYVREELIGLPIYASFDNGNRLAFSGITMNAQRTSINIATQVDTKRIRKLVAEAGLTINDVAYKYTNAYMQTVYKSKVHEEIHYIETNSTKGYEPVKITKREPPSVRDFFIGAGVELVSQIIAMIGKDYLYSVRPLFILSKGQKIWVEGIVRDDNTLISKSYGNIAQSQINAARQNNNEYNKKNEKFIDSFGAVNKNTLLVK